MPEYAIRGIKVQFPYTAYPNQLVYMEKVIGCLQEGANALLESPTGTGKTLCLLCATLAYAQSLMGTRLGYAAGDDPYAVTDEMLCENVMPKIIYASRTHSQLSQVIGELRKTAYQPKMCVLGSREQMCRHPDVAKMKTNAAKTALCRFKVARKSCAFYSKVQDACKSSLLQEGIMDIEDLIHLADHYSACSYYMAREQMERADLIFIPYNYLVDPQTRSNQNLNIAKAIVILDEAHNLEGICSDAYSFDMTSTDLEKALHEVRYAEGLPSSSALSLGMPSVADLDSLKDFFSLLYTNIDTLVTSQPSQRTTQDGMFMYQLLKQCRLTDLNYSLYIDAIEDCLKRLYEAKNVSMNAEFSGSGLGSILGIVKVLFGDSKSKEDAMRPDSKQPSNATYFKTFIEMTPNRQANQAKWTMSYWCFNPGLALLELKQLGARSIVLTSGTLAPLESLAKEFRLPFKYQLQNAHIIHPCQVFLGILSNGPTGSVLDSSFTKRSSSEYLQDLGSSLVNFSRTIPQGVLVFFPSYYLMDSCLQFWKATKMSSLSIWDTIAQYKEIFVEPKDKFNFNSLLDEYCAKASRRGALFFAIARGKVSEGIDFSDAKARAVVVIGVPYPAFKDPRVELKKSFLDDKSSGSLLSGSEWYSHQAIRAVNQAIGRVIRHKSDFGAIILCDHRYNKGDMMKQLPSWTRASTASISVFGELQSRLVQFFKFHKTLDPALAVTESSPQQAASLTRDPLTPLPARMLEQQQQPQREPSVSKAFLSRAKELLCSEQFQRFRQTLIAFRENQLDCAQMLKELRPVLETSLFCDFKVFLPKRYHELHHGMLLDITRPL